MKQIQQMERGTLCSMRGGRYFNHQTWENGRNVVRYVPAAQLSALRKSIDGYQRFAKLAEQYVDLIVQQTRRQRSISVATPPAPPPAPSRRAPQTKKGQKMEQ